MTAIHIFCVAVFFHISVQNFIWNIYPSVEIANQILGGKLFPDVLWEYQLCTCHCGCKYYHPFTMCVYMYVLWEYQLCTYITVGVNTTIPSPCVYVLWEYQLCTYTCITVFIYLPSLHHVCMSCGSISFVHITVGGYTTISLGVDMSLCVH